MILLFVSLADIFGHMVGQEEYDKSLKLCLACLENPRLNRYIKCSYAWAVGSVMYFCTGRHLLYKILDVLVTEVVPEINQSQFTSQLLLHRTRVLNS